MCYVVQVLTETAGIKIMYPGASKIGGMGETLCTPNISRELFRAERYWGKKIIAMFLGFAITIHNCAFCYLICFCHDTGATNETS